MCSEHRSCSYWTWNLQAAYGLKSCYFYNTNTRSATGGCISGPYTCTGNC